MNKNEIFSTLESDIDRITDYLKANEIDEASFQLPDANSSFYKELLINFVDRLVYLKIIDKHSTILSVSLDFEKLELTKYSTIETITNGFVTISFVVELFEIDCSKLLSSYLYRVGVDFNELASSNVKYGKKFYFKIATGDLLEYLLD